jgi:putative phosphoribosyl transferase
VTLVEIPAAGVTLQADLAEPEQPRGVVAFAHGSGSSRQSPRNRGVAEVLNRHGLATLLADLLTEPEERRDARSGELRFDIGLLGRRVIALVDWLSAARTLPIGLFGASTGAAAALVAAAERPVVAAVVSRGGRPDLAAAALPAVRAPTLLIVGERDPQVLDLNRRAAELLTAPQQLHIVPGATHLFEEPGALDQVATEAAGWFGRHLGS